ncbi:MAG: hypothetical protein ACXADH_13925 [Candidatus Kariarchaeaceae archaeon]|jgi:hypothetical protein
MKEIGELKVSIYYEEDDIVGTNMLTGEPIRADRIIIKVLKQIFQYHYKVKLSKRSRICPKRERAKLFGQALRCIGTEIERQAMYGEPSKVNINGRELYFF